MSFRKPCHMPFRKLILPFTLTALHPIHIYSKLTAAKSKLKFEDSHLPSPSRWSSFSRRLFCFATSRSVLRRSSLIRRLFSLALSRSFSSCSSVKFCRLSLSLSCSFPRCLSLKFCLLSLFLSCSLPRCSSVKLRFLSLSLSRCSSVKFCLLSLALCRSRWAWLACRLLLVFFASLYLYIPN